MKYLGAITLFVYILMVTSTTGNFLQYPYDDDKALEREFAREIAASIIQALHHREPTSAIYPQNQKRNSEIINSLLGLPKVMNEAGKRK